MVEGITGRLKAAIKKKRKKGDLILFGVTEALFREQ